MEEIRERLLRRDYLYGDARAYRAGVEAAWAALAGAGAQQATHAMAQVPPHHPAEGQEPWNGEALSAVGHA